MEVSKSEIMNELKKAPKSKHTELLARQIVDTKVQVVGMEKKIEELHAMMVRQYGPPPKEEKSKQESVGGRIQALLGGEPAAASAATYRDALEA